MPNSKTKAPHFRITQKSGEKERISLFHEPIKLT